MSKDTAGATGKTAPSLVRKVLVGAAWLGGVRITSRILGLVSTLIVARVLVPADFGLVAMATAFSQSIDSFSEVGLRDALVRHPTEVRSLYDTAFTMQLVRGLLTAGVVAMAAPFADQWFGDARLGPILLVLAALAAASGFENIAVAEFRREFRFNMEFALQVVPRALQVAAAIVAALVLRTYWALVIAIAVSKISYIIMSYAVHAHRPRLTLRRWRDLFGFSFWTWATSLASIAWARSDVFIVAPALGAALYGIYTIAWELGGLPISELLGPAAGALFPGFAEARRSGNPEALSAMAVVTVLALFLIPLGIAVSAASGPLVLVLLGPKWTTAQPLIAIFAIICAVAPLGWVGYSLLSASGRVARLFLIVAVSALVRIGMLLFAVRTGGLLTVAWWSVASLVFEAGVFAVVLRASGELRLRTNAWPILRALLASLATLGTVWWTGWGWQPAASATTLVAFFEGAGIGLFAIAVFALYVSLFWYLAGRPRGPESWIARIIPFPRRVTA